MIFSDYDTQIVSITNILNEKNGDLKKAEANLKNLLSSPTNDTTKSQIEDIKHSIEKLEKKLNDLRNTTEVIDADEKKVLLGAHEKSLKEYRYVQIKKTHRFRPFCFGGRLRLWLVITLPAKTYRQEI